MSTRAPAILYGTPSMVNGPQRWDDLAVHFVMPKCPKCNTHRYEGEDCPGCARIASQNYELLIDIEEGRR